MTQIFNKKSQTEKRRTLRKNVPKPEVALWAALRNRKIKGRKFKRQYSVGRYVVDFYCPALRLAIEIDGEYHQSVEIKEYDPVRQKSIESLGIKFLRFSNQEIIENLENVLKKIEVYFSPLLTKERGWG